MENELCGALTGIHIAGAEGTEKSFVLYRPPFELPRKVARDKALNIIVMVCTWPFNETGLFHQIRCKLQHL